MEFKPAVQDRWDQSSYSNWLRCEKYYQYNNVDRWRKPVKGGAAFFGDAIHKTLYYFYGFLVEGMEREEALRRSLLNLVKEYGEALVQVDNRANDLYAAMRTIVWYVDTYKDDYLQQATLPDGRAAVEVRFEVACEEVPSFSGIIDRLVWMEGLLFILDYKTTGTSLYRLFSYMEPSIQNTTYIEMLSAKLGLPIAGVIIDGMYNLVNSTEFNRRVFIVDPTLRKEFFQEMWPRIAVAREKTKQYIETGDETVFSHNWTSCGMFGGCPYREVCVAPPLQRAYILGRDYERRPPRDFTTTLEDHADAA